VARWLVFSGMNRIGAAIAAMVLLALGTLACGTAPAQAAFSTTLTLQPGRTVVIESEDLGVTFDSVRTDSRCPPEVVCIWEGDAAVAVALATPAAGPRTVVDLHTNPQFTRSADYAGYRVELTSLNPAGDELTLLVTKG
jgi:hypothetical protein